MSELSNLELIALMAPSVESLSRAGRAYLCVLDPSGEPLYESSWPRGHTGDLRSAEIDVDDGPTLRLAGELDEERVRSIAHLLQQTVSLHRELQETRATLGRTREELAILFEMSQTLSRVTTVEDVVERFLADVVNVLEAREGTFLALDRTRQELRILCHHGSTPRTVAQFRLRLGEGVAGRVAQDGEPRIINDTSECDYYVEGGNPVRNIICAPMRVGGQIIGVVSVNDRRGDEPFSLGHLHLLSSLARLGEVGLENARLYEEVRGLLFDAVEALIGLMEARDPHSVGHSRRVARLAYSVGRQQRQKAHDLERLYLAALVHDIGKVALPPELIDREGSLTEFEQDMVRQHPEIGAGILRSVRRLGGNLPGLLEHHERWDGAGYPKGLAGDAISAQGRIIAVVDAYDSLTYARSARQSLRPAAALAEIKAEAGSRFDPAVVESFEHVYKVQRLESSVPPVEEDQPWDSSGGMFSGTR